MESRDRNRLFVILLVGAVAFGVCWLIKIMVYPEKQVGEPVKTVAAVSIDQNIEQLVAKGDTQALIKAVESAPPAAQVNAAYTVHVQFHEDFTPASGKREFYQGPANLTREQTRVIFKPLLKSPNPQVRSEALKVMGVAADRKDPRSIMELVNDPDKNVRLAALNAVGTRRIWDYENGSAEIINALSDDDRVVRAAALDAINNTFGLIYAFPMDGADKTTWANRAKAINESLQEMRDGLTRVQRMLDDQEKAAEDARRK